MNVTFLFGAGSEKPYKMPLGDRFIRDVITKFYSIEECNDLKHIEPLLDGIYNLNRENLRSLTSNFQIFFRMTNSMVNMETINYDIDDIETRIDSLLEGIENLDEKKNTKLLLLLPFFLYANIMMLLKNHPEKDLSDDLHNFIKKCTHGFSHSVQYIRAKKRVNFASLIVTTIQLFTSRNLTDFVKEYYDFQQNKENLYSKYGDLAALKLEAINCILLTLEPLLDYNSHLLQLVVKYMKNNDLTYFRLSQTANETLSGIYSSHELLAFEPSIYDFINQFFRSSKNKFHLISPFTANYTRFAEDILGHKDIIYLHGKLNRYYDFKTRHFIENEGSPNFPSSTENHILPYLILQSSVKVVDDVEMTSNYRDMYERLSSIDYLIIHGLSLNPDDNHITNLLIKACHEYKRLNIIFLNYGKNIGRSINTKKLNDKFANLNFQIIDYDGFNKYENFEEFMLTKLPI